MELLFFCGGEALFFSRFVGRGFVHDRSLLWWSGVRLSNCDCGFGYVAREIISINRSVSCSREEKMSSELNFQKEEVDNAKRLNPRLMIHIHDDVASKTTT